MSRSERLPAGSVTFLLTDVEGSTSMWENHPDAMSRAIARHHALVDEAIVGHGGGRPRDQGEGDAAFAAFGEATDAVACALALQRSLAAEPWPPEAPIRVRVALHTGEAELRDGNYFGVAISRCARLRSLAAGGQTLLSGSTHEQLRQDLPQEATLLDLGIHVLKDLTRPEAVFQLCHPDLDADFPPLRSLEVISNNLPVQLTTFVGRERELAELEELIAARRLVTVTGAGGSGKTRLALELGSRLVGRYPRGIWFAELAEAGDRLGVFKAVEAALGIRLRPDSTTAHTAELDLLEWLVDRLQTRRLLLILDNCEHVMPACIELAGSLLAGCPELRILATSREPLRVAGETVYRLATLSTPDEGTALVADEARAFESVRLFEERARSADARFDLGDADAGAVAGICRRLDGIPLALELAAARVGALTISEIATRLDDRFRLLTRGPAGAADRSRTLRATVDWSYDLLSDEQRALLRRLSVFAGFTLESAQAVCAGDGVEAADVVDLVSDLVDRSLAVVEPRAPVGRYRLLETIREYAREKLEGAGESDGVRLKHLQYLLGMAVQPVFGAGAVSDWEHWNEVMHAEQDNVRLALEWAEVADPILGVRLIAVMLTFWATVGDRREGMRWLPKLQSLKAAVPVTLRSFALAGAANLMTQQGEFEYAQSAADESLALAREVGEKQPEAIALLCLGAIATYRGDIAQGRLLSADALEGMRATGNPTGVSGCLFNCADIVAFGGDVGLARSMYEESLGILEGLGNTHMTGMPLRGLGSLALRAGDEAEARVLYERALGTARDVHCKACVAICAQLLGELARKRGDRSAAAGHFSEALLILREQESRLWLMTVLEACGALALAEDRAAAAQLLGSAEALRERVGIARPPVAANLSIPTPLTDDAVRRCEDEARAALGEDAFSAAREAGRRLPLEDAIDLALDVTAAVV